MHESDARADAPDVAVRATTREDTVWLTRVGLDPEKVGRQYHWAETPLQLYIAPARAVLGPRGPAAIVELDGRRAGYVGRSPLSGHLECFLQPWARERGIGSTRSRCSSATTARRIANGDS